MEGEFYTYIARCNDGSFYVGSTNNIKQREEKHNEGIGSQYTNLRRPVKIIYFEKFTTRTEAGQREMQLKGWAKIKKENLINFGHPNPNKIKK